MASASRTSLAYAMVGDRDLGRSSVFPSRALRHIPGQDRPDERWGV